MAAQCQFFKNVIKHKLSFDNDKYLDATSLSVYIWELKKRNIRFKLTWKIIGRAKSYNPTSQVCNLCNLEKYFILYEPQGANLNKRDEMFNFCKHRPLYCLANQTWRKGFKIWNFVHKKIYYIAKIVGAKKYFGTFWRIFCDILMILFTCFPKIVWIIHETACQNKLSLSKAID